MAEQSVLGLFGLTPELYQQQQQAEREKQQMEAAQRFAAPGTMSNPSLAPFYAAATQQGQMIGQAGRSLLGIEDPQLKLVTAANKLVQEIGTDTPEKLQRLATELGKIPGGAQLAMQAADRANQMMKSGAEAKTAAQKYEDLNAMRDELAKLGNNATDAQIMAVVRKYGSADSVLRTLEMADLKRMQMQAKLQADADKAAAAKAFGIQNANDVLNVINQTRPLITNMNTGDLGGRREIYFTGAGDLQTKLDTIKANLSMDKLQQMKEASKTGASGLGSLAVKELETLQAVVASLDRKQSAESLQDSLDKVERHYRRYIAYMSGAKSEAEVGGPVTSTTAKKAGVKQYNPKTGQVE